jgi:hypothetical protein
MTELGGGGYDEQDCLPVPYDEQNQAELEPDPLYGDITTTQDMVEAQLPILPEYDTDLVVSPPQHPVKRPQEVVRRERGIQAPYRTGILSIDVGTAEVQHRQYRARPGPDGQVDANVLIRTYFESLREGKKYPHEVTINTEESTAIDHYGQAQLRVGRQLKISDAVDYKIKHTPYHIFTDKDDVDSVVASQMGPEWVTTGRGIYTPVTGVLWVRTNKPAVMESGLARMVVESSAAALALPPDSGYQKAIASAPHHRNHRQEKNDTEFEVVLGSGYDRRDILPKRECTGLHHAVGDMAALRVLREGNYRGRPILSKLGINVVLDGVIRETAKRQNEDIRTVADDLLKGYYTGHLHGLNRILDALGRAGSYHFLTLSGQERAQDIRNIAKVLKIPDIAHTYRRIIQGENGNLYRW